MITSVWTFVWYNVPETVWSSFWSDLNSAERNRLFEFFNDRHPFNTDFNAQFLELFYVLFQHMYQLGISRPSSTPRHEICIAEMEWFN